MKPISQRALQLKQSGIRSASVRCAEINGINLGQGLCDLPVPTPIREAAERALRENHNKYSPCEGILPLREKLAQKIRNENQISVKTENVIVTHGSTGAFVSATVTLLEEGDEAILLEPFYGYHKNVFDLHGVVVKTAPLSLGDFSFDLNQVRSLITEKTKVIVLCTPCNPCGKIYSENELKQLGDLAKEHDLWIWCDEIYEYIVYPGYKHVSPASLEGLFERTITFSGFSKTYNMTGWRLGYASGPEDVMQKMALAQDYLYVCPNTPLQHAVLTALELPQNYYTELANTYLKKRDYFLQGLKDIGFTFSVPQGAYYVMAEYQALGFKDDLDARDALLEKAKVATVPGRSFYLNPQDGKTSLRFCYAVDDEKLEKALQSMKTAFN